MNLKGKWSWDAFNRYIDLQFYESDYVTPLKQQITW